MTDWAETDLALLFLHALPLDGRMWSAQADLFPGAAYAPTLYGYGDTLGEWATAALALVKQRRVVIVGCSVGGSCALEIAAMAPERVAAMVLMGTKAGHRPDAAFHASALKLLRDEGIEAAWEDYWAPLFADGNDVARSRARQIAIETGRAAIAQGVTAFHTRPDRESVLTQFDGPIRFLRGAADNLPRPDTCIRQAALARDGRLDVVEDCGHYLPMERPGALNAVLREVIAELV